MEGWTDILGRYPRAYQIQTYNTTQKTQNTWFLLSYLTTSKLISPMPLKSSQVMTHNTDTLVVNRSGSCVALPTVLH